MSDSKSKYKRLHVQKTGRMPDDGYLKGNPKDGSKGCDCWRCMREKGRTVTFYILCDICGNKRCPRASDHRLECTHSNEAGQEGSVYE